MAANKTVETDASVDDFLNSLDDEDVRKDCQRLVEVMQSLTKSPPSMWGDSIVGFGKYQYKYATGREGEWFLTGFSPRKQNLSLYVMGCVEGQEELLKQLGKVKHGKSCIYVKQLSDIHLPTLKKIIRGTIKQLNSIDQSKK